MDSCLQSYNFNLRSKKLKLDNMVDTASDHGRQFESNIIEELCKLLQISKSLTICKGMGWWRGPTGLC